MEADPSLLSFNVTLGVLLVDILLSGDNAIVIALVCRSLSPVHRTKALLLGVIGAFLARLALTSCATLAMSLPLIKLIGGILLLKISIDLIVDTAEHDAAPSNQGHSSAGDLFAAARTIVLADVVMSLDNVLALSAITQNNWPMLVAGLLMSIPILMFGSLYVSRLLDLFPYLLWVGGAILGAVSGALIIEDPILGGVFSNASSLAALVVPVLAGGFVVQISRVITVNAQRMRSVPKPEALLDILWRGESQAPMVRTLADVHSAEAHRAQAAATPQELAMAATPVNQVPVRATTGVIRPPVSIPASVSTGGDHRVLIALGLFMLLSGGLLFYMLNVFQPPVPNQFINYTCKQPAVSISYWPGGREIRFTTAKGAVATSVIEGRIAWEDDQQAGTALAIKPPSKLVSADSGKLVLNGGAFENTTCYLAVRK